MATGYNNGVSAVYIVGKDFLDAENRPDLFGVPFLAIGQAESARKDVGVSYLSLDQMKRLREGMLTEGDLPTSVEVRGVAYSLDRLASGYVPYSFGVGHRHDEQEGIKVRSLSNFDDLVDRIIPEVARIRQARAETIARDDRFGNRALAMVGLYKPASFTRYEPVATMQQQARGNHEQLHRYPYPRQ